MRSLNQRRKIEWQGQGWEGGTGSEWFMRTQCPFCQTRPLPIHSGLHRLPHLLCLDSPTPGPRPCAQLTLGRASSWSSPTLMWHM